MEQNTSGPTSLNLNSLLERQSRKHFLTDHFYLKKPGPSQNFLESLKNVSLAGLEASFNSKLDTNISFIKGDVDDQIQLSHNDDKKENTCTQTSKTILQLANLEKGQMTPDSLNSPKSTKSPNINSLPKESTEEFKVAEKSGEEHTSKNMTNSLSYMRKGHIKNYLCKDNDTCDLNINDFAPKNSLTEKFLSKKKTQANQTVSSISEYRSRHLQQTSPLRYLISSSHTKISNISTASLTNGFKSHSFVEPYIPNYISDDQLNVNHPQSSRFTIKRVRQRKTVIPRPDKIKFRSRTTQGNTECCSRNSSPTNMACRKPSSFMAPTLASEQKSRLPEVQICKNLIPSPKCGRTLNSEKLATEVVNKIHNLPLKKIPYIDQSIGTDSSQEISLAKMDKMEETKGDLPSRNCNAILQEKYSEESIISNRNYDNSSMSSTEHVITVAISHLRNSDWSVALRGLAELTELCKTLDPDIIYPFMPTINQRLIELLRSARSHVCRIACQAAGHFFEFIKDTRGPGFDDIVNLLLSKTADTNKFIRKDANLALDCMVTHISAFRSVRVLSAKGPEHKNSLVRAAVARLIVCAVVIAGPCAILNSIGNDGTRKRVFLCLVKFIQDKSPEVRKFGERLYKTLKKEDNFEFFLAREIDREELKNVKAIVKHYSRK